MVRQTLSARHAKSPLNRITRAGAPDGHAGDRRPTRWPRAAPTAIAALPGGVRTAISNGFMAFSKWLEESPRALGLGEFRFETTVAFRALQRVAGSCRRP